MSLDSALQLSLGLGSAAIALVFILVLLRIYIRCFVTRSFALDDVLLLGATAAFFGMMGIDIAIMFLWDSDGNVVSDYVVHQTLKCWLGEELLYIVSTCLLKLSISVFLLRLAVQKIHRVIIYATATIYTGASLGFFLYLIFRCHPVKFLWDNTIPGGYCKGMPSLYNAALWSAVFATLTDFVYSLLPIWILWNVQMDKRSKVSVAVILSLGLISSVVTAFRFAFLDGILVTRNTVNSDTVLFELCSIIEPAVGIIAASLSTMRSFLRGIYRKLGLTWTTARSRESRGSSARPGFWSLKKHRSGYTMSTTEGSNSTWLQDLPSAKTPPRPEKFTVLTRISTGPDSLMSPQDIEKGWGITRTDRWSISENIREDEARAQPGSQASSSIELVIQPTTDSVGKAM